MKKLLYVCVLWKPMRKFKRFYHAVLLLTVILLLTVSKQIGAINYLFKRTPAYTVYEQPVTFLPLADTIPKVNDTVSALKDSLSSKINDTIPVLKDSLRPLADTNRLDSARGATLDTFSLKISKDSLEAPIEYAAEDSAIGMVQGKTIELYGKAKTDYQSSSLSAPYMRLNQATGVVSARAGRDSVGDVSEYITMNDGQGEYKSDSLDYNFKNQRGLIRGTISQQGEMFIHSQIAKKVNENTVYATGNFFTTCNLDHPHFGFRANRAKIVNKKLAVTGAVRPEFDSVPVPLYLPFGFYPLYQGRHSGFMAPSFETNDQEGVGLSRLGYYLGISDYWDVQFTGDVYSFGTWSANALPTYRKIYKYQGNLNFGIRSTRRNTRGDPDFFKSMSYIFNWSHTSDRSSRPGVTFGANVNWSSTNYSRLIPNNAALNFQNVIGSSITYSKQWIDKPFNLSLSMNHSQNNASRLMTFNFPTANFAVTTLYPLQKKESIGKKKWYEQLGIGYNGSFRNDLNVYDTVAYSRNNDLIGNRRIFKYLLDTARWSANHSIPITLSLPPILGGALVIAPSVSYSQEWVDRQNSFYWGPRTIYGRTLDNRSDSVYTIDTINAIANRGFKIKQQASFGISFNTALYGSYEFKSEKVKAIRHVMRPTFGLNYTPDLNKNAWQRVRISSGSDSAWVNTLDGLYSAPVSQFTSKRSGGFSFGFDNNLEMKVKAKPKKKKETQDDEDLENEDEEEDSFVDTKSEDAENGIKKIKLIDGFGFNGSYNFLADSLRLSPISMYFRTNLFEKININASATLVPYQLNDFGYATSTYAWAGGGGFKVGTVTNATISMSTSFQSKPKDADKAKARKKAINESLNDPMLQGDQTRLLEYMRQNPAEFVDFNTPWSINLSYSLSYSRLGRRVQSFQTTNSPITSSVNFNGSFNLTPKWNFSVNGFYDFSTAKVQSFSMAISRDLHCWQMSINVTPIGLYRFFNFTISPKASILQDLKINRTRSFISNQ